LRHLYTQHAAASFDKQVYLRAMLGKARWSFALEQGTLAFSQPHEMLQLSVQLLGTESQDSNTWLWAWANQESGIPTKSLEAVQQLRSIGQTQQVPELMQSELALTEEINGGRLAAIATGICRAACYFRVAYPGGVLYMLIKDAQYKRSVRHPLQRIAKLFPAFAKERDALLLNQRTAYLSYLSFYRLSVSMDRAIDEEGPSTITAILPARITDAADPSSIAANAQDRFTAIPMINADSSQLIAQFDAAHQLVALQLAPRTT